MTRRSGSEPGRTVVVAEPQFKGPAHATVNAALIEATTLAFPEARAVFLASSEHGPWVRRALEETHPRSAQSVDWRTLPALPSLARVGRRQRLTAELRVWMHLLRESRRSAARALVICSLTRTGILLVKLLAPLLLRSTPVLAVVHQLNELDEKIATRARSRRLSALLRLPTVRSIRLVAPASAVYAELVSHHPQVARHLAWLDLPYLWQEETPTPLPEREGELVFGFFGVGRPGRIEPFCELAAEVRRRHPRARFLLVGHLDRERPELARWAETVEGLAAQPLSLEALRQRARQVHYALWTSPKESYGMTLSASFLDALSFVKPCVFLDNSFIAHYTARMGEIGFRCQDLVAMTRVVSELLEGGLDRHYGDHCRTILAGRKRFAPAVAAESIVRLLSR